MCVCSYVQRLLDTIKTQDDELKGLPREGSSTTPPSLAHQRTPSADVEVDTSLEARESSPVPELAAGAAFESRVRSIIRQHAGTTSQQAAAATAATASSSSAATTSPSGAASLSTPFEPSTSSVPNANEHMQWGHARKLSSFSSVSLELPSKEESQRLFDVFSSRIGSSQHLLDQRTFFDSLDMLYQDDESRASLMQSMWFSQYLLIMAIAKHICSRSGDGAAAAGGGGGGGATATADSFFDEAMGRLPPQHDMGSHGVTAVEVLCLASLYLQWRDRKHDAYLYIGSAVRLALALGCALPIREQSGLSSTRWHRTRVWWTAYIHDRRLSAALGVPMGVDERQIRADLPQPAPGFDDPVPLLVNVQIARQTGDIMTSLYGNATLSSGQLVNKIQTIMQDLYETQRSIPAHFAIDLDRPRLPAISRTSASLYLVLFQAIILCIRPMILQRVKDKVQSDRRNLPPPPKSPAMTVLCTACRGAAINSIRILSAIQQQHLFGCFDLDVTFSAAFILVMKGFLEISDLQKPPEGLRQAADMMRYLAESGSKAAEQRLAELRQFCHHVWSPDKMSDEWGILKETWDEAGTGSANNNNSASNNNAAVEFWVPPPGDAAGGVGVDSGAAAVNLAGTPPASPGLLAPWAGDDWHTGSTAGFMDIENFGADLNLDMGTIYSCYNDPSLPLTGIDELDWAEVGKMFSMNEV